MQKKSIIILLIILIGVVLALLFAFLSYSYFKSPIETTPINTTESAETPVIGQNSTPESSSQNNPTNSSTTNRTKESSGGGGSGGSSGGNSVCIPDCAGKECGDNGCGVSCAICRQNETCDAGRCIISSMINIASYSEIKTNLYGPFKERLTDGVWGTGLMQEYYRYEFEQESFNQSMEFRFNESQKISKIRFTLPPANYSILADTDGDGSYDKEIVKVTNGKTYGFWGKTEWEYVEWNVSVDAYALKLISKPSLHILEFQIFVYKDYVNPEMFVESGLEQGVFEIEEGEIVSVPSPDNSSQYLKGMYVEDWMLGLTGFINYRKNNTDFEFRSWNNSLAGGTQSYQGALDRLRNLSANMIWIMPCRALDTYNGPVMWPSNYINKSSEENYLKMIVDAFHEDGIKVFVGERPYPGWKIKDGLNITEREMFAGGMAEIAASGADGVSVCYDEVCHFPYYVGSDNGDIGKAIAGASAAKAVKPDIQTITNVQLYNKRSWGFPDLGNMADISLLGTEGYFTMDDPYGHWHPAISTSRMIGANPKRKSIITQNVAWASSDNPLFYDTFPPVSLYGATLSSIMHGGEAVAYWRMWFTNDDYTQNIKPGYEMLDTLSGWGGKNATVPNEILVLHSYKSSSIYSRPTGWAYYAIVYLKHFKDYPLEEIRGYVSEEAVLEVLLKNGYPFQYKISDYGNDITNLNDYKVIVIPFAYSINSTTLVKLEGAVNNGTKLIILGKPKTHNASVTSTVSAAFNYLINHSNVTILNEDILHGITDEFESSFLESINTAIGQDKPTFLNRYGNDIELSSLEKSENEKFMLVTNWENHSATIDIGINMPQGNYQMLQRDLNNTRNITISGKYVLAKEDLAKFRVNLDGGEALIFYIYNVSSGDIGGTSKQSEASEYETPKTQVPSLSLWSWFKGFLTANTIKEITGYFLKIKA